MIDKIIPSGQVQNLPQNSKAQKSSSEQKTEAKAAIDEVVISKEAIDLAEIKNMASRAGAQLSENNSAVLSSDKARLNALI